MNYPLSSQHPSLSLSLPSPPSLTMKENASIERSLEQHELETSPPKKARPVPSNDRTFRCAPDESLESTTHDASMEATIRTSLKRWNSNEFASGTTQPTVLNASSVAMRTRINSGNENGSSTIYGASSTDGSSSAPQDAQAIAQPATTQAVALIVPTLPQHQQSHRRSLRRSYSHDGCSADDRRTLAKQGHGVRRPVPPPSAVVAPTATATHETVAPAPKAQPVPSLMESCVGRTRLDDAAPNDAPNDAPNVASENVVLVSSTNVVPMERRTARRNSVSGTSSHPLPDSEPCSQRPRILPRHPSIRGGLFRRQLSHASIQHHADETCPLECQMSMDSADHEYSRAVAVTDRRLSGRNSMSGTALFRRQALQASMQCDSTVDSKSMDSGDHDCVVMDRRLSGRNSMSGTALFRRQALQASVQCDGTVDSKSIDGNEPMSRPPNQRLMRRNSVSGAGLFRRQSSQASIQYQAYADDCNTDHKSEENELACRPPNHRAMRRNSVSGAGLFRRQSSQASIQYQAHTDDSNMDHKSEENDNCRPPNQRAMRRNSVSGAGLFRRQSSQASIQYQAQDDTQTEKSIDGTNDRSPNSKPIDRRLNRHNSFRGGPGVFRRQASQASIQYLAISDDSDANETKVELETKQAPDQRQGRRNSLNGGLFRRQSSQASIQYQPGSDECTPPGAASLSPSSKARLFGATDAAKLPDRKFRRNSLAHVASSTPAAHEHDSHFAATTAPGRRSAASRRGSMPTMHMAAFSAPPTLRRSHSGDASSIYPTKPQPGNNQRDKLRRSNSHMQLGGTNSSPDPNILSKVQERRTILSRLGSLSNIHTGCNEDATEIDNEDDPDGAMVETSVAIVKENGTTEKLEGRGGKARFAFRRSQSEVFSSTKDKVALAETPVADKRERRANFSRMTSSKSINRSQSFDDSKFTRFSAPPSAENPRFMFRRTQSELHLQPCDRPTDIRDSIVPLTQSTRTRASHSPTKRERVRPTTTTRAVPTTTQSPSKLKRRTEPDKHAPRSRSTIPLFIIVPTFALQSDTSTKENEDSEHGPPEPSTPPPPLRHETSRGASMRPEPWEFLVESQEFDFDEAKLSDRGSDTGTEEPALEHRRRRGRSHTTDLGASYRLETPAPTGPLTRRGRANTAELGASLGACSMDTVPSNATTMGVVASNANLWSSVACDSHVALATSPRQRRDTESTPTGLGSSLLGPAAMENAQDTVAEQSLASYDDVFLTREPPIGTGHVDGMAGGSVGSKVTEVRSLFFHDLDDESAPASRVGGTVASKVTEVRSLFFHDLDDESASRREDRVAASHSPDPDQPMNGPEHDPNNAALHTDLDTYSWESPHTDYHGDHHHHAVSTAPSRTDEGIGIPGGHSVAPLALYRGTARMSTLVVTPEADVEDTERSTEDVTYMETTTALSSDVASKYETTCHAATLSTLWTASTADESDEDEDDLVRESTGTAPSSRTVVHS